MRTKKRIFGVLLAGCLTALSVGPTAEAEAWSWRIEGSQHYGKKHGEHHEYRKHRKHRNNRRCRDHHGYPQGRLVFELPHGYVTLSVGGSRYHYHNGTYYKRGRHGYQAVRAPHGARIRRLPRGHRRIHTNGTTYYSYNDVYYQRSPGGYVVVQEPVIRNYNYNKPKNEIRDRRAGPYTGGRITVNIPNHHGGFTSVNISRSGDGFIGPQGEYYATFPRVEQLKMMYGSS